MTNDLVVNSESIIEAKTSLEFLHKGSKQVARGFLNTRPGSIHITYINSNSAA